jgi:hypothetical protein
MEVGMRKFGPLFFALVLSAMMLAGVLRSDADAGGWLAMVAASGHLAGGSSGLVLQIKKHHHHHHHDDNNNTGQQGERSCPPGYVVLDKPNKYGAFCEPKEGLPAPAPAEAEKCKFPGQVGTPPNCSCPDGTEFLGFKGCVKYTLQEYCNDLDATGLDAFSAKCKDPYYGTPSCATFSTAPPHGSYRCCCYYRAYSN